MTCQPFPSLNASQAGFRSIPGVVPRDYFYHVPAEIRPGSPVIVSVHGISMNAAEHMVRLRGIAEANGAVIIAPHFSRKAYPRFQQLQDIRSGTRADLALIDMLADVRRRYGLTFAKIHLTGFSGGAQFAHRFALYHADLVASCVSCAAGWYSFPDELLPFPLGAAPGSGPAGMSLHPDWMKVRHHVFVGSRDTIVEDALNMTAPVVAMQGIGRRERARRWVKAMNEARGAAGEDPVGFTVLRGLSHDFTRAHERHGLTNLIAGAMGILPATEQQ